MTLNLRKLNTQPNYSKCELYSKKEMIKLEKLRNFRWIKVYPQLGNHFPISLTYRENLLEVHKKNKIRIFLQRSHEHVFKVLLLQHYINIQLHFFRSPSYIFHFHTSFWRGTHISPKEAIMNLSFRKRKHPPQHTHTLFL